MNGTLPPRLLRFYDQEVYANALVDEGRIRLSAQWTFTEPKDASRADSSEGHGRLTVPNQQLTSVAIPGGKTSIVRGDLECGFVNGNPAFIFCTSLPEVDIPRMKSKMGDHLVEIFNPELFRQALLENLNGLGTEIQLFEFFWRDVQYDKGSAVADKLDAAKQEHLAYMQKSADYSHECEYRFVATLMLKTVLISAGILNCSLRNPELLHEGHSLNLFHRPLSDRG